MLPKSPIIGQAWEKWRNGFWKNVKVQHNEMWNLTDVEPPIFPHSPNGCSVVLGETTNQWNQKHSPRVFRYTGNYTTNPIIELVEHVDFQSSTYSKRLKRGVLYGPFCYYQVLKRMDKENGLSKIYTQKGTKDVWKGCGLDGTIESECLLPLIDSKHLKNLNYEPQMWLIAPLDKEKKLMLNDNQLRVNQYPRLHRYWIECQKQYDEKRNEKTSARALEMNYGYKNDLEDELKNCGNDIARRKVVYNSSGNTLRAIRIPCHVIANSKLYYILCETEQEAQYLVGVINAPNMQPVWRKTKTSKMDYHKAPFRSIPIPLFDANNKLHIQITSEIERLESLDKKPDFSGLNPLLEELMPTYVLD